MDIAARLKAERERLGFSQTAFGKIGGAGKTTVIAWERGTAFPNAYFLAQVSLMGVDVQYVITGSRDYEPPEALTAEEQVLLERYRAASREVRNAAMGALLGTQTSRKAVSQVFRGNVGQSVKGDVRGGTANFDLRQTKSPKRKP